MIFVIVVFLYCSWAATCANAVLLLRMAATKTTKTTKTTGTSAIFILIIWMLDGRLDLALSIYNPTYVLAFSFLFLFFKSFRIHQSRFFRKIFKFLFQFFQFCQFFNFEF